MAYGLGRCGITLPYDRAPAALARSATVAPWRAAEIAGEEGAELLTWLLRAWVGAR